MELDQILFKKIIGIYKNWKTKNAHEELSRTIRLEDISPRLTLIARALTGKNIDIMPAEKEGGWKKDIFYLPVSFSLFPTLEENLNFYIFRIVYMSVQSKERLNWKHNHTSRTLEESRKKAEEIAPQILKIMEEEYHPVFQFYSMVKKYFGEEQYPSLWLYGKYMLERDVIENGSGAAFNRDEIEKSKVKPSTEIKSKPVEEVEILQVDKKAQEDFMLTHNFEKVETAEEFSGVWRGFDGDDCLKEDADALNELNLKHLVRTDESAHSIYQAEFRDLSNISESDETEHDNYYLTYQEWDFSKKRYKPDFCKVFSKKVKGGDLDYANTCISNNNKNLNALRRKFAYIHQKRQTVKRLPDGERIDIDALVDWYADLQSGRTPSENIYFSKRNSHICNHFT